MDSLELLDKYLVIRYDNETFYGRVVEVNRGRDEIHVSCTQIAVQNRFAWPRHPDIYRYQRSDILAMIPPPSKSKQRFQVYPDVWDLMGQFNM